MPKREIEHKILPIFVTKVDADQGIVDAIVSVFGVLDMGNDVIEVGSFVKTITERGRKVRVLDAHNSWSVLDVIGKPLEMKEVGRDELPDEVLERFPEATGGLATKTQFLIDTPEGFGVFARIKSDSVNEYSIGYEVIKAEYRKIKAADGKEVNARILKEIKLWEYSPVVWGMNPATATVGAKNHKEMTAQGPVTRLGDYVQGRMRYVANACSNEMLTYGRLSNDEHSQVNVALEAAMKAFVAALPEEIALAPVSRSYGMYYDSQDAPDNQKEDERAPAPTGTNMTDVMAALAEMRRAIKAAGIDIETAARKDDPQLPQAGPDAGKAAQPPTDETRKRLLDEINGELDDISILEAQ